PRRNCHSPTAVFLSLVPAPSPVSDEDDLSADQPPPQTNAWLPHPDGYARRTPRLEAAARQAAPAADGRDSTEAARVNRGRLAQLPEGGPPASARRVPRRAARGAPWAQRAPGGDPPAGPWAVLPSRRHGEQAGRERGGPQPRQAAAARGFSRAPRRHQAAERRARDREARCGHPHLCPSGYRVRANPRAVRRRVTDHARGRLRGR